MWFGDRLFSSRRGESHKDGDQLKLFRVRLAWALLLPDRRGNRRHTRGGKRARQGDDVMGGRRWNSSHCPPSRASGNRNARD